MTKILVIEDNESTRDNLNEILDLEGFEALVAVNGKQGVTLAQEHVPDLIICDVMMPELDGYEVLEQLSQYEATASIPFIFLTAKATHLDFRQGMKLGANDYLTKPFSPSDVIQAIRTQIGKQKRISKIYTNHIHQLKENIDQLAKYNPLTQLPNQQTLALRLEALKCETLPISLLSISLDQFSFLTSTLNSVELEQLIKLIAHRLYRSFSSFGSFPSIGEVFHINDNQFSVLINHTRTHKALEDIAHDILVDLALPCCLPSRTLGVTASVGIASTVGVPTSSLNYSTVDQLIQDASTALYQAQKQGGNIYCFYHSDMTLTATTQLSIANALYYALEYGEFEVYYQPQVDLKDKSIFGVEALLRWKSSKFGNISPSQFIPIAENNGLINDLGSWVLWTACKQAKVWQKKLARPMTLSVNLSPIQLSNPSLLDTVRTIISKSGLSPSLLHLEITETALAKHQKSALDTLKELKEMGIKIAIDDFGTGYSGLGYLSSFPCNVVKIDRLFIQNIHQNQTNQRIISAVFNMCHDLDLRVVAEGVETELELAYLKEQNCDLVQGYAYAKPMMASQIPLFVKQANSLLV